MRSQLSGKVHLREEGTVESSLGRQLLSGRFKSVLLVILLFLIGCSIPLGRVPRVIPAPQVDHSGIALERLKKLTPGLSTKTDFLRVLGTPADSAEGNFPGDILWLYPIRAWNTMGRSGIVPAPILRIRFNPSGTVQDWSFHDSVTGDILSVKRSLEQDSRWFRDLTPPPMPPYIQLAEILKPGVSTRDDVSRALEAWHPRIYLGDKFGELLPVIHNQPGAAGNYQDYYVDRPSALFIPPHYLIVAFHQSGILRGYWFQATYPGGNM